MTTQLVEIQDRTALKLQRSHRMLVQLLVPLFFVLAQPVTFAFQQFPGLLGSQAPDEIVEAELVFSFDRVYPGSALQAAVIAHIKEGWHVNSHETTDEFAIPTVVTLDTIAGATLTDIIYPQGQFKSFGFSESELSVYEGDAIIGLALQVNDAVEGDQLKLAGKLSYQACNDVSCLAPAEVTFQASLPIAALSEPANLTHTDIFAQVEFDEGGQIGAGAAEDDANEISLLIEKHGLGISLLFIFLGGLALNLTPCVYPLIPITVSYFSGQTEGSARQLLGYAVVYVIGMALVYSTLGVIAALTGSLFGSALQSPPVLVFVAAVMVLLALSMFGLYEIRIPSSLSQLAGGSKPGYFGSFVMGLTVGIVAAPCIGPIIFALLAYVGATGDPVLGFSMFFTLSLGLGVPYLLLGTFSGLLNNLPRSGVWMVWVKKVFGVILLALAGYFLAPLLPEPLKSYLLPAILLVGAAYIGFVESSKFDSKLFPWIRRAVALCFAVIGILFVYPETQDSHELWQEYTPSALEQARAQNKPVIIDFTAEWCLACKELEKFTFTHEDFLAQSGNFVLLRADLTRYGSEPVRKIRQEFDIKGLPTVVFLDRSGVEIEELRVVGFINGREFADRMNSANSRQLSDASVYR